MIKTLACLIKSREVEIEILNLALELNMGSTCRVNLRIKIAHEMENIFVIQICM
jgi:hypothetical protein